MKIIEKDSELNRKTLEEIANIEMKKDCIFIVPNDMKKEVKIMNEFKMFKMLDKILNLLDFHYIPLFPVVIKGEGVKIPYPMWLMINKNIIIL